ncbi:hypothetical protein [Dyella sp. ASV21]|nr:hypothetical protein [Dyella sp. ASV21]
MRVIFHDIESKLSLGNARAAASASISTKVPRDALLSLIHI